MVEYRYKKMIRYLVTRLLVQNICFEFEKANSFSKHINTLTKETSAVYITTFNCVRPFNYTWMITCFNVIVPSAKIPVSDSKFLSQFLNKDESIAFLQQNIFTREFQDKNLRMSTEKDQTLKNSPEIRGRDSRGCRDIDRLRGLAR